MMFEPIELDDDGDDYVKWSDVQPDPDNAMQHTLDERNGNDQHRPE